MNTLGELKHTGRGFELIEFADVNERPCSLQQSSAIDDRDVAISQPGSSFVWLGRDDGDSRMHLSRKQARALANHLKQWLKTGSLTQREATHD